MVGTPEIQVPIYYPRGSLGSSLSKESKQSQARSFNTFLHSCIKQHVVVMDFEWFWKARRQCKAELRRTDKKAETEETSPLPVE